MWCAEPFFSYKQRYYCYKVTFTQPKRNEGLESKNGLEHGSFHSEMVVTQNWLFVQFQIPVNHRYNPIIILGIGKMLLLNLCGWGIYRCVFHYCYWWWRTSKCGIAGSCGRSAGRQLSLVDTLLSPCPVYASRVNNIPMTFLSRDWSIWINKYKDVSYGIYTF